MTLITTIERYKDDVRHITQRCIDHGFIVSSLRAGAFLPNKNIFSSLEIKVGQIVLQKHILEKNSKWLGRDSKYEATRKIFWTSYIFFIFH